MSDEKIVVEQAEAVKPAEVQASNVEKLKDSDIRWRAKYKGAKEELETLKVQVERENKELAQRAESAARDKAMYENKYIESELTAKAIAAGIKDVDLINLIDKSQLKVNESGSIDGLEAAITDFKTRKPDFFGSDRKVSSSSNVSLPAADKPQAPNAWDLSDDAWRKNKSKFMRGKLT